MNKQEARFSIVNEFIDEIIDHLKNGEISGTVVRDIDVLSIYTKKNIHKAIGLLWSRKPASVKLFKCYNTGSNHNDITYGFRFMVNTPEFYLPRHVAEAVYNISNMLVLQANAHVRVGTLKFPINTQYEYVHHEQALNIMKSFKIPEYIKSDQFQFKFMFDPAHTFSKHLDYVSHMFKFKVRTWLASYNNISRPTLEFTTAIIHNLNSLKMDIKLCSVDDLDVDADKSIIASDECTYPV